MKPMVHARSTARRLGGKPEDYLDIHKFLDCSRDAFPDLRHRALTHNSWFVNVVLPRVFGETRINSAKRQYSVTDVGEHHVHEDFKHKFIPSAQDWLTQIEFQNWMDNGNGEPPPSHVKLSTWLKKKKVTKKPKGKVLKKAPYHAGSVSSINLKELLGEEGPEIDSTKNFLLHQPGRCGPPGTFD